MAENKKGHYGYCSDCGSRQKKNGICRICGTKEKAPKKKAEKPTDAKE